MSACRNTPKTARGIHEPSIVGALSQHMSVEISCEHSLRESGKVVPKAAGSTRTCTALAQFVHTVRHPKSPEHFFPLVDLSPI